MPAIMARRHGGGVRPPAKCRAHGGDNHPEEQPQREESAVNRDLEQLVVGVRDDVLAPREPVVRRPEIPHDVLEPPGTVPDDRRGEERLPPGLPDRHPPRERPGAPRVGKRGEPPEHAGHERRDGHREPGDPRPDGGEGTPPPRSAQGDEHQQSGRKRHDAAAGPGEEEHQHQRGQQERQCHAACAPQRAEDEAGEQEGDDQDDPAAEEDGVPECRADAQVRSQEELDVEPVVEEELHKGHAGHRRRGAGEDGDETLDLLSRGEQVRAGEESDGADRGEQHRRLRKPRPGHQEESGEGGQHQQEHGDVCGGSGQHGFARLQGEGQCRSGKQ